MKRTVLALVMAGLAATVFATGLQEADENGVFELRRGPYPIENILQDQKTVKIEGTVLFESPEPKLVSDGKTYSLFAPGAMQFYGYLKEGDKISVNGYLLDDDATAFCLGQAGRRGNGAYFLNDSADRKNVIWVDTVEIDGKTYKVPDRRDDSGFGMYGHRNDDFSGNRGNKGNMGAYDDYDRPARGAKGNARAF